MDHLTNTPKKLSVKFDNICSVCIVCSCDVSTEKGIRRLASKYKDTLLKLDSEYQDIFTSIEHPRFLGKVFLCRKCSLEIQKYIDIEKNKDDMQHRILVKTQTFKRQYVHYKRAPKTSTLSPFAKDKKYRKIAMKEPMSPSKIPVPIYPATKCPSPLRTFTTESAKAHSTRKLQKRLFTDLVSNSLIW